jgi:hypothetical protein
MVWAVLVVSLGMLALQNRALRIQLDAAHEPAGRASEHPEAQVASTTEDRRRSLALAQETCAIAEAPRPDAGRSVAGTPALPLVRTSSSAAAEQAAHDLIVDTYQTDVLPGELSGRGVELLERIRADRERPPDDRLEAVFVLRALQGKPPTEAQIGELLQMAADTKQRQLTLDVLDVMANATAQSHVVLLEPLLSDEHPDIRMQAVLRLREVPDDPAARKLLSGMAESESSEPLQSFARYLLSSAP